MQDTFDIVDFIKENPLSQLQGGYESILINKIKENLDEESIRIFMSSFYAFLNYDPNKDFVIDLKDVWKWCGFSRIDPARRMIKKYFIEGVDYIKIFASSSGGAKKKGSGGHNKETTLLSVNTFKEFCMRATTKEASKIHKYFIAMEKSVMETMKEQHEELVRKLQLKDNELMKKDEEIEHNVSEMEKNILINSKNTPLVYIGIVGDNLVKFGYSKGIQQRVLKQHKKDFDYFILKYTVHSIYYIELEDMIKSECNDSTSPLYNRRVVKEFNGKTQTELIQLDETFKVDDLYQEILTLRANLNNVKRLGENKYINELQRQVKEKDKKIKKLRNILDSHNIEYDDTIKEVKFDELLKKKYFYSFLEHYISDKKDGKYFETTTDFYKKYLDYFNIKKYQSIYLLSPTLFNITSLGLKKYIQQGRKTLPRDHPDYTPKKDNRVKVKYIFASGEMRSWLKNALLF